MKQIKFNKKLYTSQLIFLFQGNVEVFGANHIVDDWLTDMVYKQKTVNAFKNIDIEEYEKQDVVNYRYKSV